MVMVRMIILAYVGTISEMPEYGHCREMSVTVSGRIPKSEIYYGLYLPDTDEETWHPYWQGRSFNAPVAVFTHFWVEYGGKIIDHASDQFGGPKEQVVPLNDRRYVKVGRFLPKTFQHIPMVSDPVIKWDTYSKGVTKVIWTGMYDYLDNY
jgi:hypothetical protein